MTASVFVRIEAVSRTDWRAPFGLFEPKRMCAVSLTDFVIAFTRDVAEQLVPVEANRANEMRRLVVCHARLELENDIALTGLEKFVAALLPLEFILLRSSRLSVFKAWLS